MPKSQRNYIIIATVTCASPLESTQSPKGATYNLLQVRSRIVWTVFSAKHVITLIVALSQLWISPLSRSSRAVKCGSTEQKNARNLHCCRCRFAEDPVDAPWLSHCCDYWFICNFGRVMSLWEPEGGYYAVNCEVEVL